MATLETVIGLVRHQLQDTRAPVRHSDSKLVSYLNVGLADIRRLRPDLFLRNAGTISYEYTSSDLAETLPLEFSAMSPLIDHIVASVSLEDDEFVSDGRAVALMSRFTQKLVGKGA